MNNTTFKNPLVLLIILLAFNMIGQAKQSEPHPSEISELVSQYMLNHPNENYVIQTDRDLYFSGTELWFSVWSLDDQTLSPFSYSRIVYAELIDRNGESMAQQTLKVKNNSASGRIVLPENLTTGTYYLRTYSNFQRNFGEQLFGVKLLQVINPLKPPVIDLEDHGNKPVVSVFPEGQKLLHGITNKMVVKATFPNGQFIDINEGFLIKEPSDTIAKLEFINQGIGYCSFYADTTFLYHLALPGIGKFPLEIQGGGLTLNIQEEISQLKLRVLGNNTASKENHYLIGKTRGQVFLEQVIEKDLEEVVFPYSSLPEGLLEFSILNSKYEEKSQRLYYHKPSPISLSSDLIFKKLSFKKGEDIDMEILLPEENEFKLLSLCVRKDMFVNHSINQNFKSFVHLYPFINDWDEFGQLTQSLPADKVEAILDIYLITQKSSKYQWRNILQPKPDSLKYLPEVDFKQVTGYGYNPVNSIKINDKNLVLYFVGHEDLILKAKTDDEGIFCFNYPIDKKAMCDAVIQASGYDEKMEVSLDWPFHQSFQKYKLDYFHFDTCRFDEYDKAYVQAVLEKMYKNENKQNISNDDKKDAFYGVPDSREYLEDYITMKDMAEVFKEIVPGEKISVTNNEYNIQITHKNQPVLLGDHPLLLFNGAPISNFKEVLNLPVSAVDYVDLVRQDYVIFNKKFNGIINIVTQDLNLQLTIPPNACKTNLNVFSEESQFFQTQRNNESRIPKLNPTLYWNPNLSFEGNTKQITFSAGNNSGRYQVLLKGIDTEGKILELSKFITIE